MRVLVVDATHGGMILAEEYARNGHEVVCVDVYKTVSNQDRSSCFTLVDTIPPLNGFDLVVSPVHFPAGRLGNIVSPTVITHHQAVRSLVEKELRCPVIEVTGSFGKTETIMAALHLLKRRRTVLALTSNGVLLVSGGRITPLSGPLSSTPANIIKAIRLCKVQTDVAIFEVSLGGTGMADLGIIKNVYDNYRIAGGTLSALEAKLSMVKDKRPTSTCLVNVDDPLLAGITGVQRFSPSGRAAEVSAQNIRIASNGLSFLVSFRNFITLGGEPLNGVYEVGHCKSLIGRQHVENLLVASAISAFLGDADHISGLEDFEGGRKMVLDTSSRPKRVVNISSSIGPTSLRRAIEDFCEAFSSPVSLCLGGAVHTTCGYLDPRELASVLEGMPQIGEISLFGELGTLVRPMLKHKKVVDPHELCGDPILYIERR